MTRRVTPSLTHRVKSATGPRNMFYVTRALSGFFHLSGVSVVKLCNTLRSVRSPKGVKSIVHATRTVNLSNLLLSSNYYSICGPGILHTDVNKMFHLPLLHIKSVASTMATLGSGKLHAFTYIISTSTVPLRRTNLNHNNITIVNGRKDNLQPRAITTYAGQIAVPVTNHTRSLGTSVTTNVIL